MEIERVRGNPPGVTNAHVATNIRAARQAIGMDLRTMSDALDAAGRKLSPSGISKLENGDRRVDVDDLTVIAYLLRTSPAALLTPPEGQTTFTGVPESFLPEEIEKWARGELVLTSEGLLAYWQQEWVQCINRIQYFESTLKHGTPNPASHDDYTQRLAALKERQQLIRERGVQVDPTGRVFDAADYLDRFTPTE
ncbi:MAG TPA: helix-turn-helix transcriptional regulator [Gryllotalpicola sp.]